MSVRAQLLRSARKEHDLTLHEAGVRVGLRESQVCSMERGRRTITEETIRRYVDAGLMSRDAAATALLGPSNEAA